MLALKRTLDNIGFLLAYMFGGFEATALDKYYYGFIFAKGREFIASELGSEDPFRLTSAEIVVRVLAAGYTPYLEGEQRYPGATSGRIERVEHEGQSFIVAVDEALESLSVQEVRGEPYPQRKDKARSAPRTVGVTPGGGDGTRHEARLG